MKKTNEGRTKVQKKQNYKSSLRQVVKPSCKKQNEKMWAKSGVLVCIKDGFSCLASCVGTNIAERRAWQHPSVFCSNELGDARDVVIVAKQTRTQEISGTRRREHFSEPTSMCGQVLLSRNHRRERKTFCTCFANARWSTSGTWLAGGVEMYSRVDGRYLPEQLRVRIHCCWRVTPSGFFACHHWAHGNLGLGHWNQIFLWHATKMGQERSFGTIWNSRTSSCLVIPTQLYLHEQARAQQTTLAYLARTSSQGLYFRAYLDLRVRLCVYFCICISACASLYLFVFLYFLCARVSVFIFLVFS